MESINNVNVLEAYDLMRNGTPLLDVRTQKEHADGHPPACSLNPWMLDRDGGRVDNPAFVEDFVASFPQKDVSVLLMCRSGARSGNAIKALQAVGYVKLLNVAGGFISWTEANLPHE